jgi:hypothetical protein
MVRSSPYGLMPRILLPVMGGGVYYLIAHYGFSDPDARGYAISITVGSGGPLIFEYLFQRSHGLTPRIVISILAGALFYLIAHYVFSYRYAERSGIAITVALGGLAILDLLFKRFRGLIPRLLIPILAGGSFYLIAHYVFSYPHAARLGIFITAASVLFYAFRYINESPTEGP